MMRLEKEYELLLEREVVPADKRLMASCINYKSVMVTGAGGTIGSELCRQIAAYSPRTIMLFERSEIALYAVENEIREQLAVRNGAQCINVVPILGSIRNKTLLEKIIKRYNVDTIYHAAAYKQVPMLEKNVIAGVQNNIFGTLTLARAAEKLKVKHFIFVSTDKAVRPSSIMGATKRVAEQLLQAIHARKSRTCFSMVRFGNVLGSSGSVLPLFRKQILNDGPVTVTHPEVSRYFMTAQEAAHLVIQAGGLAEGGDVFILDMGAPVRIIDMARKLIELMGFRVCSSCVAGDCQCERGIAIAYTGLRDGEKLTEELLIGMTVAGTSHTRILRAMEYFHSWQVLEVLLGRLEYACHAMDQVLAKKILAEMVTQPVALGLSRGQPPEADDCLLDDTHRQERSDQVVAVKH